MTHVLRGVHVGRSATTGFAERSYLRRLRALGVELVRDLIGTPRRGVVVNKHGMYEVLSYPGIDVVCVSGVGGGSHGWLGLLVEPSNSAYWERRHPDLRARQISGYYEKIRSDLGATRLTRQHRVPTSVWTELPGLAGQRCQPADPQPDAAYLYPKSGTDAGRLHQDSAGVTRRFCAFDGDSLLGSRDGAKSSVDVAYLAPVLDKGVTVRALSEVSRIVRQPGAAAGGYVVHYRDLRGKTTATAWAQRVVLAAGTMNTLRLLFDGQQRGDLAAMPSLGATFGGNGDEIGVWFKDSADLPTLPALPVLGQFTVDAAHTPFYGLASASGLDTLPLPKWVRRRLRRLLFAFGMGADSGKASAHFEQGRMDIDYDKTTEPIFDRIAEGLDAFENDTGLRASRRRKPLTVHAWGGACLGPNPEHGVVDHRGEIYGNPGLFVADAAALPAAVGAPPSLTIAAWAHHVADDLADTIARRPDLTAVKPSSEGAN